MTRMTFLFVFSTALTGLLHAERIVMNDGTQRIGKLSGADAQSITVIVDGRTERIAKSDILLVLFDALQARSQSTPSVVSSVSSTAMGAPLSGGIGMDPVAPTVSQFVATIEGFRIELLKCTKQTGIVCSMRVTNLGSDQVLGLATRYYSDATFYVDGAGMQRNATEAKLGSAGVGQHATAQTTLITDVPVQASLKLEAVDAGVTSLAKLSIAFHISSTNKVFRVDFRRVPLQGN